MSRATLKRRIDDVVVRSGLLELDAETARLVWAWGFDPSELTNGAKRIALDCQKAGAVTMEDCLQVVAEGLGRTSDELQNEIEAFLEGLEQ